MNLKEQTYLRMSGISSSNFFTKGVSEPEIAKKVKSVKIWSPPSQPTGRKMENSWYPKIFESKISLLYSCNYKYNHQKCVSKTISHHMRPKAQKYSKISPKVGRSFKTRALATYSILRQFQNNLLVGSISPQFLKNYRSPEIGIPYNGHL